MLIKLRKYQESHHRMIYRQLQMKLKTVSVIKKTLKEKYIFPEKIHKIIDNLRLIQKYNTAISKNDKFVRQ